ncbi:hypothetical protein ACFL4T_11180 [candidate division KSB1 bacterium]
MIKVMCYVLILFICPVTSTAQSKKTKKVKILWEKNFGGSKVEIGWSCQQAADKGFIIGGFTDSFESASRDIYVIKTDSEGNEQWSKVIGGKNNDFILSIKQTSDNGFIACGGTYSNEQGISDVYLVKLDPHGNTEWEKTYGGKKKYRGSCIIVTEENEYILCGVKTINEINGQDVLLMKTDFGGNVIWEKTFGGKNVDWGSTVVQTTDGGFFIGGYTESFGAGKKDIFLIRTDSSGNEIWRKTFGGPGEEFIHGTSGLIQASDGGYVICGVTTSFGSGKMDYYIFKIDENGDLEWEKYFGGTEDEDPLSIIEVENEHFIIAGYTKSYGAGDRDIYLVKINSEGQELWSATHGSTEFECAICIQELSKGEYVLCGETRNNSNGDKDVYLLKITE